MTPRRSNEAAWPTKAELDILHVLWERGASTVREVHETLYGDDGAGYTTALKLMQTWSSACSTVRRRNWFCRRLAPNPAHRARNSRKYARC